MQLPPVFEPVPLPNGLFKVIRLPADPSSNAIDVVCVASFGAEYVTVTTPVMLRGVGHVTTLAEAHRMANAWNAK